MRESSEEEFGAAALDMLQDMVELIQALRDMKEDPARSDRRDDPAARRRHIEIVLMVIADFVI